MRIESEGRSMKMSQKLPQAPPTYRVADLKNTMVSIRRHNVKGEETTVERAVIDPFTITKLVHIPVIDRPFEKLFNEHNGIQPNKIELNEYFFNRKPSPVPKSEAENEAKPGPSQRSTSSSSEDDVLAEPIFRPKTDTSKSAKAKKQRQRAPDHNANSSSSRREKSRAHETKHESRSRTPSPTPRSSSYRHRSSGRSRSPVNNKSKVPGEFVPDKGTRGHRSRSKSRSLSPQPRRSESHRSSRDHFHRSHSRHSSRSDSRERRPEPPYHHPNNFGFAVPFETMARPMWNPMLSQPFAGVQMIAVPPPMFDMPFYRGGPPAGIRQAQARQPIQYNHRRPPIINAVNSTTPMAVDKPPANGLGKPAKGV